MGKPILNAERKRKYRERLFDDKHEEIKKADRDESIKKSSWKVDNGSTDKKKRTW